MANASSSYYFPSKVVGDSLILSTDPSAPEPLAERDFLSPFYTEIGSPLRRALGASVANTSFVTPLAKREVKSPLKSPLEDFEKDPFWNFDSNPFLATFSSISLTAGSFFEHESKFYPPIVSSWKSDETIRTSSSDIRLQASLKNLESRCHALEKDLEVFKRKNDFLSRNLEEANAKEEDLEKMLSEAHTCLTAYSDENKFLKKINSDLQNGAQILENKIEALSKHLKNARDELAKEKVSSSLVVDKSRALEAGLEEKIAELKKQKSEHEKSKSELDNLKAELDFTKKELNRTSIEVVKTKNKLGKTREFYEKKVQELSTSEKAAKEETEALHKKVYYLETTVSLYKKNKEELLKERTELLANQRTGADIARIGLIDELKTELKNLRSEVATLRDVNRITGKYTPFSPSPLSSPFSSRKET